MQIKNLKIIPIVSVVLLIIVSFFCKPSSVEGASVVWTDKDIYNQGEIITRSIPRISEKEFRGFF